MFSKLVFLYLCEGSDHACVDNIFIPGVFYVFAVECFEVSGVCGGGSHCV